MFLGKTSLGLKTNMFVVLLTISKLENEDETALSSLLLRKHINCPCDERLIQTSRLSISPLSL